VNFFTPKFMIIRWNLLFFGSFAKHLKNKLSICGSNLNFKFVSMSDVEFFCLKGVLTQNFNTMDFVKKIPKIPKLCIQITAITLKMTSYKTMSKKKKVKKNEKPRFFGQNKTKLAPCPSALGQFQPCAPQKI
jgi:hypothetical protein